MLCVYVLAFDLCKALYSLFSSRRGRSIWEYSTSKILFEINTQKVCTPYLIQCQKGTAQILTVNLG